MKLKNNKGVAGVDIAVSVVILTIFISVIAGLFYNIASTSREINNKSVATNIAIEIMEKIKAIGYGNLITTEAAENERVNIEDFQGIQETLPAGYNAEISVEDYKGEGVIKIARVYVTYKEGKDNREIKIEKLFKVENKIVDVISEEYVVMASGRVVKVENIQGNIFSEMKPNYNNIITRDGVRNKSKNCFVDNKGKVYTWGYNYYGQLGNGTTTSSSNPICISEIEESVLKDANIVEIISGGNTVIARDSVGKVYTWGYNSSGQLGNGTTENSSNPICISKIEGSVLKDANIVEIISGGSTVIARDNAGKVYTWGYNSDGQLGNGTTTNSSNPICISKIEGSVLKDANIVEIIRGVSTVIARDSAGKVYTWGSNNNGQLGNGTTENSSNPICISEIEGSVLKDANIVEVINDGYIAIARDSNGKIYTWGYNGYGQLGNGTTENSSNPICISEIEESALKNVNIVEIISGGSTVIARDSNGKVYTWGSNNNGQLGNGTEDEYSKVPICISEIEGSALKDASIVEIITYGGTAIVRDNNGKVYTWGSNSNGQLGNGNTENSNCPICISDIVKNELYGENVKKFGKIVEIKAASRGKMSLYFYVPDAKYENWILLYYITESGQAFYKIWKISG